MEKVIIRKAEKVLCTNILSAYKKLNKEEKDEN